MKDRNDPNPIVKFKGQDVEVLTLHLNNGMMRIRYRDDNGRVQTADVSNAPFFAQYWIAEHPCVKACKELAGR